MVEYVWPVLFHVETMKSVNHLHLRVDPSGSWNDAIVFPEVTRSNPVHMKAGAEL